MSQPQSRAGSKSNVPEEGGSRRPSKADAHGSRAGSKRRFSKQEEEHVVVEQVYVPPPETPRRNQGPIRVLVLQCQPFDEVADAIKFLGDSVYEAGGNIDFAIFPEGFLKKRTVCPVQFIASRPSNPPPDDPILLELSAAAKQHCLYLLAGSIDEQNPLEKKHKRAYCFGRGGDVLLTYRKIVPGQGDAYTTNGENAGYSYGTHYQGSTFDTEFGKVGACIGGDAEDDIVLDNLLKKDVRLMLVPTAISIRSGKAFLDNPKMLKTTRETAFESHGKRLQSKAKEFNTTFVRVDNASGKVDENGCLSMGSSFVVGPSQMQLPQTPNTTSYVAELTQQLPGLTERLVFPGVPKPEPVVVAPVVVAPAAPERRPSKASHH